MKDCTRAIMAKAMMPCKTRPTHPPVHTPTSLTQGSCAELGKEVGVVQSTHPPDTFWWKRAKGDEWGEGAKKRKNPTPPYH